MPEWDAQAVWEKFQEVKQEPKAKHFDEGKPRMDLVPKSFMGVVDVLTYGVGKYGDRNWERGMSWGKLFGSAMRHLWQFWWGQDLDPESGLPHLAHAATCVLMLLEYQSTHPELDDRSGHKDLRPEDPRALEPSERKFRGVAAQVEHVLGTSFPVNDNPRSLGCRPGRTQPAGAWRERAEEDDLEWSHIDVPSGTNVLVGSTKTGTSQQRLS